MTKENNQLDNPYKDSISSQKEQANLSLTTRLNSLLELVPTEQELSQQLSGDEKVRAYLNYRQSQPQRRQEEEQKLLEIKTRLWQEQKEKEQDSVAIVANTLLGPLFYPLPLHQAGQKAWEQWMGLERLAERENWLKMSSYERDLQKRLHDNNWANPLFPIGVHEGRKIGSVAEKTLLEVQLLASSGANNPAQIKNFVNTVSQELTLIRDEMEKREGEQSELLWEKEREIEKLSQELDRREEHEKERLEQKEKWEQEQEELRKKAQQNAKLNSPREIHLQELVEEHRTKAQEWANKLATSQQDKTSLEQRIAELDQELASLTQTAQLLETDKNQLASEYDDLLRRWELKGNLLLSAEDRIKSLEIKISALEKELETEQIKYTTANYRREQLYKDKQNLIREKGAIERQKNLFEQQAKEQAEQLTNLQGEKDDLQAANNQLSQAKEAAEQDLTKAIQQKRLGSIFAAGIFFTDYLPIPTKLQSAIKTVFTAAQGWQIVQDLPNATYELIIGLVAVLVFLGLKKLYRRLFQAKEINKLAELRAELQDLTGKYLILREEKKELVPEIVELPQSEDPRQETTISETESETDQKEETSG